MNALPEILHTLSYKALPLIFAIVLHEYAHGWVADHFGDPTARQQGRLTLNPMAHIDPFGTIVLPLICLLIPGGFFLGWAKPVPINPTLLRNPRREMAFVAAAGPAMNLLLALSSALLLLALLLLDPSLGHDWPPQPGVEPRRDPAGMLMLPLTAMAMYSVVINLLLMAFNLIPVPPLDGGRILTCLLPAVLAFRLARLESYGMLIIAGLIVLDPHIHVLGTIVGGITMVMAGKILAPALTAGSPY